MILSLPDALAYGGRPGKWLASTALERLRAEGALEGAFPGWEAMLARVDATPCPALSTARDGGAEAMLARYKALVRSLGRAEARALLVRIGIGQRAIDALIQELFNAP